VIDDGTEGKLVKKPMTKRANLSMWSRKASGDHQQQSSFSFASRKGKEYVLSTRKLGLIPSPREISQKRFGMLSPLNQPSVQGPLAVGMMNVTSSTHTLHKTS